MAKMTSFSASVFSVAYSGFRLYLCFYFCGKREVEKGNIRDDIAKMDRVLPLQWDLLKMPWKENFRNYPPCSDECSGCLQALLTIFSQTCKVVTVFSSFTKMKQGEITCVQSNS